MAVSSPSPLPPHEALPSFQAWQNELFNLSNRFKVSLVGLAGRLKMRPDWAIEGVCLPNHLFYSVVEGAFEARIDGVDRRLNPGDTLWAGPGVPLWLRLVQPDLVLLRFRLDAHRADGTKLVAPQALGVFARTAGSQFLLERLVEVAMAPTATMEAERAVRAYLLALGLEFERPQLLALAGGGLTPVQCHAVRGCLTKARETWPSPGDLAQAAELSPPYFSRLFTRTFGRSPRRFLLEERMRVAGGRLLESSASVSQIARELGYADVFAFSRQFKIVHGQSPSLYRASHSLEPLI